MQNIIYISKTLVGEYGIDMHELFTASKESDMTTLTPAKLDEHLTGSVGVLVEEFEGVYDPVKAVAYAGITKYRAHKGEDFAQIGGVICLPEFCGLGLAKKAVEKTVESYDLPEAVAGFAAVANNQSLGLLTSIGMEQVDTVPSESTQVPHPLLVARHGQLKINRVE